MRFGQGKMALEATIHSNTTSTGSTKPSSEQDDDMKLQPPSNWGGRAQTGLRLAPGPWPLIEGATARAVSPTARGRRPDCSPRESGGHPANRSRDCRLEGEAGLVAGNQVEKEAEHGGVGNDAIGSQRPRRIPALINGN
jgi:hypothetical protein